MLSGESTVSWPAGRSAAPPRPRTVCPPRVRHHWAMSAPDTPLDTAAAIARAVAAAGGRAWMVGGAVRDRLLGLAAKDLDIEVFGVPAGALPALLAPFGRVEDRKSTRLNSSHVKISYA